jgi:hypothetical protein
VTAEAQFYQRFVQDVRYCAGGRDPVTVAEIARRVRVAMIASPSARGQRWARVVSAVDELLSGSPGRQGSALARLRAFVRENADLGRPHDVAITDFRFESRPESLLRTADGHSYLLLALRLRPPLLPAPALDEIVPASTRRLAEWAVYGLCGGAATLALCLTFGIRIFSL